MTTENLTKARIEKMVYGGEGLTRLPEGEVIFVPWSAPGDEIALQRVAGSAKPVRGEIIEILEPSPERTTPPCSVFGTCGGCQWQHLTPTAQRAWKRNIVVESLARIGKIPEAQVQELVLETLGSNDTAWRYRNRVQWEIEPAGDELTSQTSYHLGYCAAQSHQVVEFEQCHIIPETLNAVALFLRSLLQSHKQLASALLRVEAFQNQQGQILLTLEGESNPDFKLLVDKLTQAFPTIIGIAHRNSAKANQPPKALYGQTALMETLAGHTFQVSAGNFFQTNPAATERLLGVLDEWMLPEAEKLLDLYAGVGSFAIHFHERMKRVVAIESAQSAVADAQQNIILNRVQNVELLTGDARALLERRSKDRFDVAIVDPPRAGCHPQVLEWLSSHINQQLLYVSCNPTTLARDIKQLQAEGWHLEAVQPIDMFPQTYHIECIARLSRQKNL